MIRFKYLIPLLLLFLPLLYSAQTYHFANYGVKDGLAQSNVSGIVQDSAGFYWIGTAGGVSRFDGKNFENYTTADGLADNNVSAIYRDRQNNIWLGHENGSLTYYSGGTFKEVKSSLLPKDKKIYSFYEDKGGNIWICTESVGAIKMTPDKTNSSTFSFKAFSGKEGLSQYVLSAFEDASGRLWFHTDIGIKVMDEKTERFEFFRPDGMPVGQVTALYRDKSSNFLIGTVNGSITRYNSSKKEFTSVVSTEQMLSIMSGQGPCIIYAMYEDGAGNLWASVLNLGVVRINLSSGKITLFNSSNGLSVNKVRCMLHDREGNIIIGTSGEGIDVFSGERFVFYNKRNGLADNQVWAICKDKKGRYWFGTNEGITIYDPLAEAGKQYTNLGSKEGIPSPNIRSIVSDKDGNLWIGTWGGKVVKYDINSSRIVNLPALNEIVNNLVSCLMIDRHNRLWIGTLEGIVVYDLTGYSIKTIRTIDGLSDNDISCVFEQSNGNIWIGTKQKGLTVFDGKSYKKYNRESGLNYNSISSITEDNGHNIWIGTESGGALVFDGNKFRNYKIKDGLLSDFVTLLATDKKGNVWIGTNKGLNKFSASSKNFVSYTAGDGFTGHETKPRAVLVDESENIWFGTVNGAYYYAAKNDIPVSVEPITRLLHFKVNLNEVPVTRELTLSYKENSLSFEFFGISLANPDEVHYRLMLEGYDRDWVKLSNQTIETYQNLEPGTYTFKLIACNGWDVCTSQPLNMKIIITPPFWKTWWFYLTSLIVVVGGLFVFIKLRERQLRLEKKILEDKVTERTAEVVQKNKELDAKNQDITASIRYAKRIQVAILPPDDFVKNTLPNTFILFKPKDIVSGDFYWMEQLRNHVLFAAVDCTGHGVPGAFMSIVGHNLLDRIISEQQLTEPAKILDELNKGLSYTLRQTDLEDNTVRDGMDITLCSFNTETAELQFAAAYNPLWLASNGELTEYKANKFPIGNSKSGEPHYFTNNSIQLKKGDTIYIFSDGYCDQFGGPDGKKFKASNFKKLLLSIQQLGMAEQKEAINAAIENWRGRQEQVDDILVIGMRYE